MSVTMKYSGKVLHTLVWATRTGYGAAAGGAQAQATKKTLSAVRLYCAGIALSSRSNS